MKTANQVTKKDETIVSTPPRESLAGSPAPLAGILAGRLSRAGSPSVRPSRKPTKIREVTLSEEQGQRLAELVADDPDNLDPETIVAEALDTYFDSLASDVVAEAESKVGFTVTPPSPEEIAAEAARIRATWSEQTEIDRRYGREKRVLPPIATPPSVPLTPEQRQRKKMARLNVHRADKKRREKARQRAHSCPNCPSCGKLFDLNEFWGIKADRPTLAIVDGAEQLICHKCNGNAW